MGKLEMVQVDEMRIYVADLAAYNEGFLVGEWIDLPCDNLSERVAEILKKGDEVCMSYTDHEEWAIHDYELPFNISEYEDLDKLNDIAVKFDELEESDIKKVLYLIDHQGCSVVEALEQYEAVDIYEDMNFKDLAEMLVDETWEVPEHLEAYIDYDLFARELEMDYAQIGSDLFRSA